MPGASDWEVFVGALKFCGAAFVLYGLWELGRKVKQVLAKKEKAQKACINPCI